jgi:hypothetical protein
MLPISDTVADPGAASGNRTAVDTRLCRYSFEELLQFNSELTPPVAYLATFPRFAHPHCELLCKA